MEEEKEENKPRNEQELKFLKDYIPGQQHLISRTLNSSQKSRTKDLGFDSISRKFKTQQNFYTSEKKPKTSSVAERASMNTPKLFMIRPGFASSRSIKETVPLLTKSGTLELSKEQHFNMLIESKEKQLQEALQKIEDYEENLKKLKSPRFGKTNQYNEHKVTSSLDMNQNGDNNNPLNLSQDTEFILKLLGQRCLKLDELVKIFEEGSLRGISDHDLIKIREMLSELSSTLVSASKNEIEMNHYRKVIERKCIENSLLEKSYEKLRLRSELLEQKLRNVRQKYKIIDEENNQMCRNLQTEKNKNQVQVKKVNSLEKRLEAFVDTGNNQSKDKLRNTLAELLKENEKNKREIFEKAREVEKLQDMISKLNSKNSRLTKKIEQLKTKKVSKNPELEEEGHVKDDMNKQEAFEFLRTIMLPNTLEYRINNLKSDYANLVNAVIEHGPLAFTNNILSSEDAYSKKEAISLVTTQYLSLREFSEKNHALTQELITMNNYKDLDDLMVHIGKSMKSIFVAEQVNFWMADSMTGTIYTYNSQRLMTRALINKGLFNDVIFTGKSINKYKEKNIFLYEESDQESKQKFVDNALLIPLHNSVKKTIGILEISNIYSENFGMDEEYYAVVLSMFIKGFFAKIINEKSLKDDKKFQDFFYTCFLELCNMDTKYLFTQKVNEWARKIFSISSTRFYMIEDNEFHLYNSENSFTAYDLNKGITGHVVKLNRALIVYDVRKSLEFDDTIDLSSLFPVFFFPISDKKDKNPSFENQKILGVLALVLKQRNKVKEEKHQFNFHPNNEASLPDLVEMQANRFGEFVGTALRCISHNFV